MRVSSAENGLRPRDDGMDLKRLFVGFFLVAGLTSCAASRPSDCSSEDTLMGVRDLLAKGAGVAALVEGLSDEEFAKVYVVSDNAAVSYDDAIKKYSCAGNLDVPFQVNGEQLHQRFRLDYASQIEGGEDVVLVFGFTDRDWQTLRVVTREALKKVQEAAAPVSTAAEESTPSSPPVTEEAVDPSGAARPDDYAEATNDDVAQDPEPGVVEAPRGEEIKPSFDCAKAGNHAENLICSDANLAGLDRRLAERYAAERKDAPDKDKLKAAQNKWRTDVRDACQDVACMTRAVEERIIDLGG